MKNRRIEINTNSLIKQSSKNFTDYRVNGGIIYILIPDLRVVIPDLRVVVPFTKVGESVSNKSLTGPNYIRFKSTFRKQAHSEPIVYKTFEVPIFCFAIEQIIHRSLDGLPRLRREYYYVTHLEIEHVVMDITNRVNAVSNRLDPDNRSYGYLLKMLKLIK